MERRIQQIELPGGETVLARVSVMRPEDVPRGSDEPAYEDVGALDQLTARVDQLNELVSGIGSAVLDSALAAGPDEVSVTFGIELMAKPGKAVALLADGEAKAAISVTLTWRPREGEGAADPDTSHGRLAH
ncbi:CU044_2847 family protein [Streptomyces sp. NPDC058412]|uniref:CU044_2847 family protein n=1 Tax=Streptomyces sp. NPDC058412 TaxID=3346486 RepID=UPI0036649405